MDGENVDLDGTSVPYCLSSAELSKKRLAYTVRNHWSIENKLHWKLDDAMNKDSYRIRRGDAAKTHSEF